MLMIAGIIGSQKTNELLDEVVLVPSIAVICQP